MKTFPVFMIYGMPVYKARIAHTTAVFEGIINGCLLTHSLISLDRLEKVCNDN